jgi:hypothetical protein
VEAILTERPYCEACLPRRGGRQVNRAVDVHELVRRSQGGNILDPTHVLAVCRPCHDWIGQHPHDAETGGLALPGWATAAMFAEAAWLRASWARGIEAEPSWRDEKTVQGA